MTKTQLEIELATYKHVVDDIKGHLLDLEEMEDTYRCARVIGMISMDVSEKSIDSQRHLCSVNAAYRDI